MPVNAVIDLGGRRGVFVAQENDTATFRPIRTGIEEATQIEILEGLTEGDVIVTTGAGSLREGERFVVAGAGGRGGADGRQGGRQAPAAVAAPAASAAPQFGATEGRAGGGRRGGGARGQRGGEQQ